jgi:mannosyltransferase
MRNAKRCLLALVALPSLIAPYAKAESAPDPARRSARIEPVRGAAITLGVGGVVISALGSWIPSFWGDEAASIMSATRPLDTLWPMLLNVDAVHGAYYLFLHGWISVFGASEFSVRFPSAIAVGLTVVGLVFLTNRLTSARVAVFAGAVCAVLPCLTRMGAEARGYAVSAACAVWLTWLLVRLIDPRSRPWRGGWLVYAVGVAVSVYVFLFLALMVLVHAVILLASPGRRRMLRQFAVAAFAGVVAASPVIVLAVLQRKQVAFLELRDQTSPGRLLVDQWFWNPWLAALAWLLIIAAVGVWMPSRFAARNSAVGGGLPDARVVGLAWLLLPCLLLVLANSAVPLYSLRYLTFAAPAAALLIGLAVALPLRSWASWLLIAAVIAAAAPTWALQRTPYSRNGGTDWSAVAVTLETHLRPGDGIIFADNTRPSQRPRLAMHVYPDAFVGVRDVLLDRPYQERARLWDKVLPLDALPSRLAGVNRIWVLDDELSTWGLGTLRQEGFSVARVFHEYRTTIYELVRSTS